MLSLLMTTEYGQAEERHELQQLLIRVAEGECEALAELYRRTRSAVYGLALSYLKNAHDAQDITQDVYVQVVGLCGAVSSNRFGDGLAADRMPQSLSDEPTARGTSCRAQRGGMGRYHRRAVRKKMIAVEEKLY